jgi:hypothetical protein
MTKECSQCEAVNLIHEKSHDFLSHEILEKFLHYNDMIQALANGTAIPGEGRVSESEIVNGKGREEKYQTCYNDSG